MAHDVFICYSAPDKPTSDAVCATLEANRIRCWTAPRDVVPGRDYAEALIEAISESRMMVLVFSASSNSSPQVIREVERAASKGIPILPFRIEDVPLSRSMEYFISRTHWLDALTPPLEKHLQHLAETVKLLLSRAGKPERAGVEPAAPESAPSVEVPAEVEAEAPQPAPSVEVPAEVEAEAPQPAPSVEAPADEVPYVAAPERKPVAPPSRGPGLAEPALRVRAAAFGLDWLFAGAAALFLCVLVFIAGALAGASSEDGLQPIDAPALLALFLTPLCYLWVSNSLGASPGKRLLRLAVVRDLPREKRALSAEEAKLIRPGWWLGFLRTVVGLVGLFLLGLGYLWALWDKEGQTWHDRAAGTLVVQVE